MDPESGLDAVRNIGIRHGKIAAITEDKLEGAEVINVQGLIVAPGFIDIHAHGQDNKSNALQAMDGVTTALDLEQGSYPVQDFYNKRKGRAILNYGVSSGYLPARIKLKSGVDVGHAWSNPVYSPWYKRWFINIFSWLFDASRKSITLTEIESLVGLLELGLKEGGIGIGIPLGYVPGASEEEVRQLFTLAAKHGVPCLVHLKGIANPADMSSITTALAHAEATGAALHVFHVTSSGQGRTPRYLKLIEDARRKGLNVTVEAYPYTAGSTSIQTAVFDQGWREQLGMDYSDLQWVETGERLTQESFRRYRRTGGLVILHMTDQATVDYAIRHPLVMIASDGLPMIRGGEHPRGAGTFSRILGHYTRERGLLNLITAIKKITLMPAQVLESTAPAMKNKGRIRIGADADITVFDANKVIDNATYTGSYRPSSGIHHVLITGNFVVRESKLIADVFPGQAIKSKIIALK